MRHHLRLRETAVRVWKNQGAAIPWSPPRAGEIGEAEVLAGRGSPLLFRALGRIDAYLAENDSNSAKIDPAEQEYRRSNQRFKLVWDQQPRDLLSLFEYCTSCTQLVNFLDGPVHNGDQSLRVCNEVCVLLETEGRPRAVVRTRS